MRRSLEQAVTGLGGRLLDGAGRERATAEIPAGVAWQGAALDSRRITGGELFFALPGERTDGHRFVAAALAAGAAAAVVHHDPAVLRGELGQDLPADARLIRVDDVHRALQRLVARLREAGAPRRVVGITGSVGKTTTKELLAAVLGRRFRVARNEGNLNNLYGYPLSVLRVPDDAEWMVAELGMSFAGELATLARLARPDVVVYTCVRPVHLENFDDLRGIAEAKAELLQGLAPDGFCVANAGDPEVVRFVRRWQGERRRRGTSDRVVWYAAGEVAEAAAKEGLEPQVTVADLRPAGAGETGSRFTLVVRGLGAAAATAAVDDAVREDLHLALHGAYNVDNALAAVACALALGATLDDAAVALAAAHPAAGRGIVHALPAATRVVDDTYNSNPAALARALRAAVDLAAGGRRWAVLGDMLELGPEAPRYHREAGELAARLGFSPLAGVGELSRELVAAAREGGSEAAWFGSAAEAAGWAPDQLAPGDTVLVKGSRGVALDVVVERLLTVAGAVVDAVEGGA